MKRGWIAQQAPWPTEAQPFSIEETGTQLRVQIGGRGLELEMTSGPEGQGWCRWEGRLLPFAVERQGKQVHLWLAGQPFLFELGGGGPRRDQAVGAALEGLVAQVPGKLLRILVQEGDRVEAGQRLAIIESMKMEFVVRARAAGVVKRILVAVGDQVQPGTALAQVE